MAKVITAMLWASIKDATVDTVEIATWRVTGGATREPIWSAAEAQTRNAIWRVTGDAMMSSTWDALRDIL